MIRQKESQIFIKYFKDHAFLLLLPVLGSVLASIFYLSSLPPTYQIIRLYKVENPGEELAKNVILTDEAVSEIRSKQVQSKLLLTEGNKVTIFKDGPLLISVSVKGDSRASKDDLDKIEGYLKENFSAQSIGNLQEVVKSRLNVFLVLFFGALGFFSGLIISLIKIYFKNF